MSDTDSKPFLSTDEAFAHVDEMIEKRGWGSIRVQQNDKPYGSFVHTIGLDLQDFPELIAFGIPSEAVFPIFQCIISYWLKNGLVLGELDFLGPKFLLRIVEIDDETDFLLMKRVHLSRQGYDLRFRAAQLIFSEEGGVFQETEEQPFLPEIDF